MTNLCRKVQHAMLGLLLLVLPAQAQTINSMVESVSDSALFSTIAGLQGFGTRSCLSGNTSQVSKWVRAQFVAAGLTDVMLDSFMYGATAEANVVATLPGTRYPGKEIIVGGHIDSRSSSNSAPGADDDASGTAAVLEIARVLASSGYHPSATFRFVGFEAEEAGLVGSSHYAREAKAAGRDIALMINFDMIGYTSSANPERRFYVVYYPPDTEIASMVASAATSYTSLTPVLTTSYQASVDSYSFAIENFPSVNCIEYVFNPYYHSPNDQVSALDSSYVRDITRTGLATILQFDAMVATSVPAVADLPSVTQLYQNFPNPFNPKTGIRFSVPTQSGRDLVSTGGRDGQVLGVSDVKIAVFDLLGREVAVLVNEQKQPGTYEVTFDGSGMPSGVYFYRLQAGSFAETRKMQLVK